MLGIFIFYSFQEEPLSFTLTNNITLEIGQTKTIPYSVNFKNAEITFLIADSSIASIDDNKIIGIAEGTTTLRATAIYNGQRQYSSCEIIVAPHPELNYNFNITPLSNCSYLDSILYLVGDNASFKLEVLDSNNNKIDISDIDYECNDNISISKQMDIIVINSSTDCYVDFKIRNSNFIFTLPIKKF